MSSIVELWNSLLSGLGALLSFFYDLVPNYGVAIILLTVAVRTAMIPLTIKQTRSMQEMSKIQPELLRLRAKHKGDRQKLTEETMKLYKEHGVNPYGGCLPIILQMPVFIALFQVFQRCGIKVGKGKSCPPSQVGAGLLPNGSALKAAIVGGNAGFLGMNLALTPLQAYRVEGLLASIPYFAWVLLMAGTMFYQQKQMTAGQPPGQTPPQMQMMTRIMPVMLGVFSLNFPVALTIYWVTSNVWTIGQQYFMIQRKRKKAEETKSDSRTAPSVGPALPAPGNPAGNAPPDKSSTSNPPGGSGQGRTSRSRNSAARKRRKRRRRR